MSFSLEDKITYDELAPSLQAMIGINKYNDMIENMMQNADDGQLLKVGKNKTIFADDNFYIIRVATNKIEQEQMKKLGPIDLKDVFKYWQGIAYNMAYLSYLYSPYYPGQRRDYMCDDRGGHRMSAIRSVYYYEPSTKCIVCPTNSNSFSAFISERLYSKFWIQIRMIGLLDEGWADDDFCAFVVSGFTDKSGVFHDITVVRNGGAQSVAAGSPYPGLQIVYDWLGGDTSITLASINTIAREWATNWVEFYAEKYPGKVIAKSGDMNSKNMNYAIEFELPDTKPASWTDKQWENIQYMMLQPCQVGFGNHSQNSKYKIIDQQEIFEEDNIYDIDQDVIYAWINDEWVKISNTSDVLPHKAWLYNSVLNNLYWYDSPGRYIKIESNMIGNIKTAAEGQLPKIMNDGSISMHDNFIKLYVVDNDTDFYHEQSILTTDGDIIYRLDTKKKYTYYRNSGNWIEKNIDRDDIPCRIFIYNESLHRFFFYTEPGVYYRMILQNFDVK